MTQPGARTLRDDLTTRMAYTSDASLFRELPAAVAEPGSVDEIRSLLALAAERGWPVVGRGGGTSVAGNAVTDGLVLDTSRRFNRILAIDPDARTAECEPGVICDQLRDAAAAHGLTFGPDPSTHSRATLGGMVSNNSCGAHSVLWGTTADNLESVTVMRADGSQVELHRGGTSDPALTAALESLRDRHRARLRTELGRFTRQASGYGLHHLLEENGFDCARAFAGSEGTLGVVTKLRVRLVEAPAHTALAVLGFESVYAAADAGPRLVAEGAATVEGIGEELVAALRHRHTQRAAAAADRLPDGGGWLFCDIHGMTADEAESRARELAALEGLGITGAVVVSDATERRDLWKIRESAAGLATRRPDGGEAWPGWEDSAVPPEHLSTYLHGLRDLQDEHDVQGLPYGHFGDGCIHIRLSFDFSTPEGRENYTSFLTDAARLVAGLGGSVSGEHGDGRSRSALLPLMYSPEMLAAFAEFKEIFDPDRRFNPGVLAAPRPLDADLRPGQDGPATRTATGHAFSRDGGSFLSAVNRCVGVAACRTQDGAMCPSFQVTGDEVHSTRGRARVLSELLRGESAPDGWASTAVEDALDLCLSCKACVSECPVDVDMATYKAEFLSHHYRPGLRGFLPGRGPRRPLAHLTMGWMPVLLRVAARVPFALRVLTTASASRALAPVLARAAGVERGRRLPSFAARSLTSWFRGRGAHGSGASVGHASAPGAHLDTDSPRAVETVVLWPDTFTNYLAPEVGVAAVEVLEALGYRVVLPPAPVCCGLTFHSTGQLEQAKSILRSTLDAMDGHLAAGHTVIGLEPSCAVMLQHEATELLPDDPRTTRLAESITTFGEFVERHRAAGRDWPFATADTASGGRQVVGQVHCHQASLGDFGPEEQVLASVGLRSDVVTKGCCGLAGNWGFEPGHGELSRAIGERQLFPAVRGREADAVVLADGFSCRTQIADGTGVAAQHLAQVLREALQK